MIYETIEGKRVTRTRHGFPYSYTRYCIWKGLWEPTDQAIYSDRLSYMYPDTYDNLFKEILGSGQYLSRKDPKDIETFLCRLFEKEIELTGIEEECNASNGYPYWILYYRERS